MLPNEDKIVGRRAAGARVGARHRVAASPLDGEQALRPARDDVADPAVRGAGRPAQARRRGPRARSTSASGRRASPPACARSCATTTRSTPATARTGTRSRRARRWSGVMAELMGRDGGLCRGLGGSMHLVDVEHGLHGRDRRRRRQHPDRARERARRAAERRRRGRGRVLRRRRRAGRPLQRDGQPRDAVGPAADPRLREQRLRRVHAALGAHERRARQRRRRALRARARDRRRQRRDRRPRGVRALPRRRRARAAARSCSSA